MINKKIASELAVGIILIVAIAIGGIFYWQNKNNNQKIQEPMQRACTMEAKLCDDGSAVGRTGPNCEFATCPKKSSTQIANPASVYCKQNGGELEIRTGPNGGQIGYCKFSDGSECEEWAYFRKECGNEKSNITTDETVDWQIYKNTKYGFEFKYPKDWNIYEQNEEKPSTLELYPKTSINYYENSYIHFILIPNSEPLGPGPTLEDFRAMFSIKAFNCSTSLLMDYHKNTRNCQVAKIGDKYKLTLEFKDYLSNWEKETDIQLQNGNFLGLKVQTLTNNLDISSTYNKILSTFKFTK